MQRWLDVTGFALRLLARQKARALAAVMAIAVGILGVLLVAGHAIARRQAIRELMYMMCDFQAMRIDDPAQLGERHRKRGQLEFSDVEKLRAIRGVEKATALVSFAAEAKYGREVNDLNVTGVEAGWMGTLGYQLQDGRALRPGQEPPGCVLTPAAAQVVFGGDDVVGEEFRLNGWRVKTVGIAESSQQRNAEMCFVSRETAETIGRLSHPTSIVVRVSKSADARQALAAARNLMVQEFGDGAQRLATSDFDLLDKEMLDLGKDLIAEAVFLVLGLTIAVATVAELLYAGVQANLKEIGVLRALGCTRADVACQTLAQGIVICFVGGGIGLLLVQTYWFWPEVFRQQFRWSSSPALGLSALLLSLLAGLTASWLPAWTAAQADPAATMRESAQ